MLQNAAMMPVLTGVMTMPRMLIVAWRINDPTSWHYGESRAALWAAECSAADLRKARDYVAKNTLGVNRKIFIFPSSMNLTEAKNKAHKAMPPLKR
jgi:hypothetical protein